MSTDHQSQLVQYFTTEKQRVDVELVAVKNELTSALAAKEQLIATNTDRNRELDQCHQELEKVRKILFVYVFRYKQWTGLNTKLVVHVNTCQPL